MVLFILGVVLLTVGVVIVYIKLPNVVPKAAKVATVGVFGVAGLIMLVVSGAIKVEAGQGGLVEKKFGADLQNGAIVAVNGEKGPQAKILPPGWHFWYAPWIYDLDQVENKDIGPGKIGVVNAKDGKAMPEGDIYAPEWTNVQEMLDAEKFLNGNGIKGPQLTVLPPGQYRYNDKLFNINVVNALNVPVGKVAVIKSNAGDFYTPEEGEEVVEVNGVPIVPKNYRGIWREALQPNSYYMHPQAYKVIEVRTTKRIFSYVAGGQGMKSDRPDRDNSIEVKTLDGFKFPVDIRVSCKVSAENASYVVAMLADPDADPNNDGFTILEETAILPSIRSIFRNNAEDSEALQYINSRSVIETSATDKFTADMTEYRIDVDKVYVADIGLDKTDEGKALMKTQTDKELAKQLKDTYTEQKLAEEERAKKVKAEEAANQEKQKEAALAREIIATADGKAKENFAKGEAAAVTEMVEAYGGYENYKQVLIIEHIARFAPKVKLPNNLVLSIGGSQGDLNSALLTPVLNNMQRQGDTEAAPAVTQ